MITWTRWSGRHLYASGAEFLWPGRFGQPGLSEEEMCDEGGHHIGTIIHGGMIHKRMCGGIIPLLYVGFSVWPEQGIMDIAIRYPILFRKFHL